MTKPTIYLAGPVADVADHGVGWRQNVSELVDSFEVNNPLDKYNVALDDLDIVHHRPPGEGEITPAQIVENDKRLIDDSDALLVGYETAESIGTPMEVFYAHSTPKPIVLWIRDDTPPEALSPWYHAHADAIEENLTNALWQLRQRVDMEVRP